MSRTKKVTVSEPIGSVLPEDTQEDTREEIAADEQDAVESSEQPDPAPPEETDQAAENKSMAVVYLGPSIDRIVNHGTVFEDGVIPEYFKKKIEEVPAIKGLIVPVDDFAEMAKAVTLPTGRYSFLYNIVYKATREE